MRHTTLFAPGNGDTVSLTFAVPRDGVFLAAFGLTGAQYTTDANGALQDYYPCDHITFERLLFDGMYDRQNACAPEVVEAGVWMSEPVRNDCGKTVALTQCHNTLWLIEPGIYRALYHGERRHDIALIYYPPGV